MNKKTLRFCLMGAVLLNIFLLPINVTPAPALVVASAPVNIWWPTDGARVQGTQPFKAMIDGRDVATYDMYWKVDQGQENSMYNSYQDYQHKEAQVDVSGWNWHGSGPYSITFVARQGGVAVAERTIVLYVDNGLPAYTPPAPQVVLQSSEPAPALIQTAEALQPAPAPAQTAPVPNGSGWYVEPNSPAARQAQEWRSSRPGDAAKMDVLAAQPTAKWLGGWSGNVEQTAREYVQAAAAAGKTAVMVAYNIPQRDCGGYSAGGTHNYTEWIGALARGIGAERAVVILEPDALSQIDCLSQSDQQNRFKLLSGAVSVLKSNGNTAVYLDAGHSSWISADVMAARLQKANIGRADGFALNVSNFMPTGEEANFGSQISSKVGGKHFVVDTSRNGNGSNGQWCNPWGRAIGQRPTTNTGNGLIDAYLWIKTPGESDGNCNGGPSAGVWWPEYALSLVR